MGKILGNLTNEQIALPGGGTMTAKQAQNSIPEMPDPTSGLDAQPKSTPSTVQTPSFLQAMNTGPGGTANIMSPELSTKGKILTALMSGAFGALAGAGQKTVGEGFQQGAQLPWEQAHERQQAESGALDLQQKKLQNQYFPQILAQNFRAKNAEITKNEGEGAKATAEAGAVPGKTALEQAQTEAAYYKDDPNLGLIDLRTKQPVSDAGFAPLTADEAQVLGKQPGERVPLRVKNTASEITNRGKTTVNTEQGVFDYNRNTGTKTKLGDNPRMVFSPENRIIQTADPNKPGETTFMKAGQAVKQGAAGPQSASVQTPKAVLKAFTSGQYSQNLNAIDTARKHMTTFRQLAGKLNNGDTRSLNVLGNAIGTQFGSDKATNFNIAKHFFSGEVGKAVVAGGGTAGERDQLAESIDTSSSWEQLAGALTTADSLLGGKQKALKDTYESGMQGKPNFGEQGAPQAHPFFTQFGGNPR